MISVSKVCGPRLAASVRNCPLAFEVTFVKKPFAQWLKSNHLVEGVNLLPTIFKLRLSKPTFSW